MGRTAGARNADYADRRWALARKIRPAVFVDGGVRVSLRDLAVAGGTTVSTLKHYFTNRAGVLQAVLETQQLDAAPFLTGASIPTDADLRRSLERYVAGLRQAWFVHGVGRVEAGALALGLSEAALGPAYINAILEPLLQSFEQLLRAHILRGQMVRCDERFAALSFLSPLVLGLLHQDALSGSVCRPLNLDAFVERHLEVFIAAHQVGEKKKKRRAR